MKTAAKADVARAKAYLRLNAREGYHWGMMRGAWASVADLAIMQMQDLLGLGSEGRINIPSTLGGNWTWRCLPGVFTPQLARRLRRDMDLYDRLPAGARTASKKAKAPQNVPAPAGEPATSKEGAE